MARQDKYERSGIPNHVSLLPEDDYGEVDAMAKAVKAEQVPQLEIVACKPRGHGA
jgi:hypothetical protein